MNLESVPGGVYTAGGLVTLAVLVMGFGLFRAVRWLKARRAGQGQGSSDTALDRVGGEEELQFQDPGFLPPMPPMQAFGESGSSPGSAPSSPGGPSAPPLEDAAVPALAGTGGVSPSELIGTPGPTHTAGAGLLEGSEPVSQREAAILEFDASMEVEADETFLAEMQARLEEDPGNLEALEWMAYLQFSKDQVDQAIHTYLKLIDRMPRKADYRFYLAQSYEKAGYLEEARQTFEQVLQLDAPPVMQEQVRARLAGIEVRQASPGGPVPEDIGELLMAPSSGAAAEGGFKSEEGEEEIAQVLTQYTAGDGSGTVELERKLANDPGNVQLLDWLAFMHYSNNDNAKARDAYLRLVHLDPSNQSAYYYLGNTCLKLDDVAGALAQWETLLQRFPKGRFARKTRRRVDEVTRRLESEGIEVPQVTPAPQAPAPAAPAPPPQEASPLDALENASVPEAAEDRSPSVSPLDILERARESESDGAASVESEPPGGSPLDILARSLSEGPPAPSYPPQEDPGAVHELLASDHDLDDSDRAAGGLATASSLGLTSNVSGVIRMDDPPSDIGDSEVRSDLFVQPEVDSYASESDVGRSLEDLVSEGPAEADSGVEDVLPYHASSAIESGSGVYVVVEDASGSEELPVPPAAAADESPFAVLGVGEPLRGGPEVDVEAALRGGGIAELEAAFLYDPTNIHVHRKLAGAYLKAGRHADSVAAFEDLSEFHGGPGPLFDVGRAYLAAGNAPPAVEKFELLLERYPESKEAGSSLQLLVKARSAAREAEKTQPALPEPVVQSLPAYEVSSPPPRPEPALPPAGNDAIEVRLGAAAPAPSPAPGLGNVPGLGNAPAPSVAAVPPAPQADPRETPSAPLSGSAPSAAPVVAASQPSPSVAPAASAPEPGLQPGLEASPPMASIPVPPPSSQPLEPAPSPSLPPKPPANVDQGQPEVGQERFQALLTTFLQEDRNRWEAYAAKTGGYSRHVIATVERLVSREPDNLSAREFLAYLYLSQGRGGAACRVFQSLADRCPGDPRYLLYMGNSKLAGGDPQGATAHWREASSLDVEAPAGLMAAFLLKTLNRG